MNEARHMTRREREITDENELQALTERCKILHLGLCDGDQPYVVPMNYGCEWRDGKPVLYLHCARRGYKLDLLAANPKCAYEMECDIQPFAGDVACKYGNSYGSFMGVGTAQVVEDVAEKRHALALLMRVQTGKEFAFDEKMASAVTVLRIDTTSFSGKRRPQPQE